MKWWDEYGAEASVVSGEKWTVDVQASTRHGLNWIEGIIGQGLCRRAGRLYTGGNSGYQAVGLAYQFGAKKIVLLGFDMQKTAGRVHWHTDHPAKLGNEGLYQAWVTRFEEMARDLIDAGVSVVNATRSTALQCFGREPLEKALPGDSLLPISVKGMQGLGDNIYQRAVIKELCKTRRVYLETSWPELYSDLPLFPVKPQTKLRTQAKNIGKAKADWSRPPIGTTQVLLNYAGRDGTILQALEASAGLRLSSVQFDLPARPRKSDRPYVVVRPVTVRGEWPAESRNPEPAYIAKAAVRLKRDFKVISIADLSDGEEWIVGQAPEADEIYHRGELSVTELIDLVAGSAGVVGGVGWLVPAAIALKVPMFLVFGGWGFHNGPLRIFDPRLDTGRIRQVLPDKFCMCGRRDHYCSKTISDFDEKLECWAVELAKEHQVLEV